MPILECDEAVKNIDANDELEVNFDTGLIKNLTKNEIYFEVICSDPVPGPRGGEFHYENFIRTIRVEFWVYQLVTSLWK